MSHQLEINGVMSPPAFYCSLRSGFFIYIGNLVPVGKGASDSLHRAEELLESGVFVNQGLDVNKDRRPKVFC